MLTVMSSQVETPPFGQFLVTVAGGKEVGLVVGASQEELESARKALEHHHYTRATTPLELMDNQKVYLVLTKDILKGAYDFVTQYATGQVELWDSARAKSVVATPRYSDSTVVLLTTQEELNAAEERGLDLLGVAGPTFRT
jgi:hypothetical protein